MLFLKRKWPTFLMKFYIFAFQQRTFNRNRSIFINAFKFSELIKGIKINGNGYGTPVDSGSLLWADKWNDQT